MLLVRAGIAVAGLVLAVLFPPRRQAAEQAEPAQATARAQAPDPAASGLPDQDRTEEESVASTNRATVRRELERERGRLLFTIPDLQGRRLLEMQRNITMLTELIAHREGRDLGDPKVRNVTGAVMGVVMSCMIRIVDEPEVDYIALVKEALIHVEEGLPL